MLCDAPFAMSGKDYDVLYNTDLICVPRPFSPNAMHRVLTLLAPNVLPQYRFMFLQCLFQDNI